MTFSITHKSFRVSEGNLNDWKRGGAKTIRCRETGEPKFSEVRSCSYTDLFMGIVGPVACPRNQVSFGETRREGERSSSLNSSVGTKMFSSSFMTSEQVGDSFP